MEAFFKLFGSAEASKPNATIKDYVQQAIKFDQKTGCLPQINTQQLNPGETWIDGIKTDEQKSELYKKFCQDFPGLGNTITVDPAVPGGLLIHSGDPEVIKSCYMAALSVLNSDIDKNAIMKEVELSASHEKYHQEAAAEINMLPNDEAGGNLYPVGLWIGKENGKYQVHFYADQKNNQNGMEMLLEQYPDRKITEGLFSGETDLKDLVVNLQQSPELKLQFDKEVDLLKRTWDSSEEAANSLHAKNFRLWLSLCNYYISTAPLEDPHQLKSSGHHTRFKNEFLEHTKKIRQNNRLFTEENWKLDMDSGVVSNPNLILVGAYRAVESGDRKLLLKYLQIYKLIGGTDSQKPLENRMKLSDPKKIEKLIEISMGEKDPYYWQIVNNIGQETLGQMLNKYRTDVLQPGILQPKNWKESVDFKADRFENAFEELISWWSQGAANHFQDSKFNRLRLGINGVVTTALEAIATKKRPDVMPHLLKDIGLTRLQELESAKQSYDSLSREYEQLAVQNEGIASENRKLAAENEVLKQTIAALQEKQKNVPTVEAGLEAVDNLTKLGILEEGFMQDFIKRQISLKLDPKKRYDALRATYSVISRMLTPDRLGSWEEGKTREILDPESPNPQNQAIRENLLTLMRFLSNRILTEEISATQHTQSIDKSSQTNR
jgi:hypothetical protein